MKKFSSMLVVALLAIGCNDSNVNLKIDKGSKEKSNTVSSTNANGRVANPTGLLTWSSSLRKWQAQFTDGNTVLFNGPYPLPTNGTQPSFYAAGVTGAPGATYSDIGANSFSINYCQANVTGNELVVTVAYSRFFYRVVGYNPQRVEITFIDTDSRNRTLSGFGGGTCPQINGQVVKICDNYYAVESGYSVEVPTGTPCSGGVE